MKKERIPLFLIIFCILSLNPVFGLEGPSIVGEAKKAILGPVDEHLGYEPIEDMSILVIPINLTEAQRLIEVEGRDKSQQLFKTYNGHPKIIHVKTDSTGTFSAEIPEGSYIICAAYKFPWNQTWDYYIHKYIDIEKDAQIKLTIILNSDWGGLRIEGS